MNLFKFKIASLLAIITILANSLLIQGNNCSCCEKSKESSKESNKTYCHSQKHLKEEASRCDHQSVKGCSCKDDCNCKTLCQLPDRDRNALVIQQKTVTLHWIKLLANAEEIVNYTIFFNKTPVNNLTGERIKIPFTPRFLPLRI